MALLNQNADPTKADILTWFRESKNICSCTEYDPLADAVLEAAKVIRGDATKEELWSKLNKTADPSALAKVTGTLDFGADLGLKLPEGTLHIKLVKSQVSQANILSIDASEAEKIPGVFKVITYKDVTGTNRVAANKGGGKEKPILCDKKVSGTGDPIAMVLAFTSKLAEEGAKKVKVNLDASASADTSVNKAESSALEPDAGFAYLDERGKLIIHSKNKELNIHTLADGIGVPAEKLAVIKNPSRAGADSAFNPVLEGLLGVAALAAKKPVYLEL